MRVLRKTLSNFAQNTSVESLCVRPETEQQLEKLSQNADNKGILVRGRGLSYNDSSLSSSGLTILGERYNHFISFDPTTGMVVCQPAVSIKELFNLDPNWTPAVVPGTVHATVGGAIAHDVHGKNQFHEGNFSDHVVWVELHIRDKTYRISATHHSDLWRATIGGAGLSGIIKRVALQLKHQSQTVQVQRQRFDDHRSLLQHMKTEGLQQQYQVAWLNMLESEQSILSWANHTSETVAHKNNILFTIPKMPFSLAGKIPIQLLNRLYFRWSKECSSIMDFTTFNNPLDRIRNWQNIYGPHGLLQFQCVFPPENADQTLHAIQSMIQQHRAIPCLAILKYLAHRGSGYLSFTQPGFTLAIDFMHCKRSIAAIESLHEFVMKHQGKIYLAKDFLLTKRQFQHMYPEFKPFMAVIQAYQSPMRSNLGKRLGLHS